MAASSYSLNQQEIHYFIETRASVRSSKYRSKHQSDRGLHLPVTAYVYSSFVKKSYECSLKAKDTFLTFYSSLLDTLVTEAPTIGSSDVIYKKVGDFLYTFSLQLIKLTNDRHLHGTVFQGVRIESLPFIGLFLLTDCLRRSCLSRAFSAFQK